MDERIVDFSDPVAKSVLYQELKVLRGPHKVRVVKHRRGRSDRQNRYYWPMFVNPLCKFLNEQGERYTPEQVHEMFKLKFLREPVVDHETGEVIGQTTKSTTRLNTREFNEYLDRVAGWLEGFGIRVPEPNAYREKEFAS